MGKRKVKVVEVPEHAKAILQRPETPDWLKTACTPEKIAELKAEEQRLLDGEKKGLEFFAALQKKLGEKK